MKYKVIATIVVLLIIVAALALRGCSNAPAMDENGNPIPTEQTQY